MARAYRRATTMRSGRDLDALPERDAIADHLGFGLGIGVVPDGIRIELALHQQRVVAGLALPLAVGLVVRESHVLAVQRALGKVVVAFHHDGVVALRDDRAVPG